MSKKPVNEIGDELDETKAMMFFMREATTAILREAALVTPGEQIILGMSLLFTHIETRLDNTWSHIKAL